MCRPRHVCWLKCLLVRACMRVCFPVYFCHMQPYAPPSPDKRAHVHTCLSSVNLPKAVPACCTWDTLAFGFAQHLQLFPIFVGYYYQHAQRCLPCSSPLTLPRPTDLLNKWAQTNTFIHVRVKWYPCFCVTLWSLDDINPCKRTTVWMNQEHCSGMNKFSVVVLLQKVSVLLAELGHPFVNWTWQNCYICCVTTTNVDDFWDWTVIILEGRLPTVAFLKKRLLFKYLLKVMAL